MMSYTKTPDVKINAVSEWLNHHKFLLMLTAGVIGWSFSYFAPAADLQVLRTEFVQYRFEDITRRELVSTINQIDNLKKIPEINRPDWAKEQIERLKREEKRLEQKLSDIKS